MSKERVAEVLEMPAHEEGDVAQARRLAQGRAAVERYVERLENATERLKSGPEASELYCALAELREGMIEHDADQVESLYRKAIAAFNLSHDANLGLRRLSRSKGNFDDTVSSIERELVTAKPERKRSLQLELVRTYLYCKKDAVRAIEMLEAIDRGCENGDVDVDAKTQLPEENGRFDVEYFLLWEDALLAVGDWDRYEKKLRKALGQQKDLGLITQHLEERLWFLYRFVKPDDEQTRLLCGHLVKVQPLDDELVEDELKRAQKNNNRDKVVSILKRAIERLEGSPREHYYRSLLADIAAYQYEDRDHALDVLDDHGGRNGNDLILLNQQQVLLADSGNSEAMLDIMAKCLELVKTPQLKAELLHTIACVLRDEMDQGTAAVEVFSEANELCPTYGPTIEALAEYYTAEERWDKLVQLYEYDLSYASSHQLPEYTPEVCMARHAVLAHLYEHRLKFALNAFNHYQAILKYRPDDIIALKGASRMAQIAGNWTELLQLYAKAEGCTQDLREHIYLLERIAQIADVYMNDADTACTALEALRQIDSEHSGTVPALARLYLKLERWEDLIALTDEEIETTTHVEYKASLLCRNAEVCEQNLGDIPRAVSYYEKARACNPNCQLAFFELDRIYLMQKSWEKLIGLLKSATEQTADLCLKGSYLRRIAVILNVEMDSLEEAVSVYENCLKLNPRDDIARHFLLNYYRQSEKWSDVLRILDVECEVGGTLGAQWLSQFWKGRIQLYRMNDEKSALSSFGKAFLMNPDDITLFRTWLSLSNRVGNPEDTRKMLAEAMQKATDEEARDEIILALSELELAQTNDPKSIEKDIIAYCTPARLQKRGTRFLTSMAISMAAANGEWTSRIGLALQPRQAKEIQYHGLAAGIIMDLPEPIRDRAHELLCQMNDADQTLVLWSSLAPYLRPDYHRLPAEVLS